MSYWKLYERSRNIGSKRNPFYVTIWHGMIEGQKKWLVNSKPNVYKEDGPIFSVDGGPSYNDCNSLKEAIKEFKSYGVY